MSSCWPGQHSQDSADTPCLVPFLTSRSTWKLHYKPWVWYLESSCQCGQMPMWGTTYLWGICFDLWETGDGEDLGKFSPPFFSPMVCATVCACLLGEVPSSQQVHPPEALLHPSMAYYEVVASWRTIILHYLTSFFDPLPLLLNLTVMGLHFPNKALSC